MLAGLIGTTCWCLLVWVLLTWTATAEVLVTGLVVCPCGAPSP
jgi:hypothetical protein